MENRKLKVKEIEMNAQTDNAALLKSKQAKSLCNCYYGLSDCFAFMDPPLPVSFVYWKKTQAFQKFAIVFETIFLHKLDFFSEFFSPCMHFLTFKKGEKTLI